MAKSCCVCSESKDTAENALFSCSSPGCDVTVHQGTFREETLGVVLLKPAEMSTTPSGTTPKFKLCLISF